MRKFCFFSLQQYWILFIFAAPTKIALATLQTLSCNATKPLQRVQGLKPTFGWLTSPLYPQPYPTQQKCIFELTAGITTGLIVHLTYLDVDLEDRFSKSQQCLRDYLLLIITGN